MICAQANGIIIGAFKTAAADLMAQVSDSESDFDLKRNLLFFAFGGAYLGAFQYWYQVNIFKRIFTATERFTSQSLEKKLKEEAPKEPPKPTPTQAKADMARHEANAKRLYRLREDLEKQGVVFVSTDQALQEHEAYEHATTK